MRTSLLWMFVARAQASEAVGAVEGEISLPSKRAEAWAWVNTESGPLPAAPATAEMRQVGTAFVPDLLVVPQGTVVAFPNDGPDQHNVHWITTGYSDNLGTYRKGESEQRAFDVPGVYPIGCHRHPWMHANIVVVPNLWFAPVVDGKFRIDGLPPGTHEIVVWSEAAEVRAKVEVEAGRTTPLRGILSTGSRR